MPIPPEVSVSRLERVITPIPSTPGIAILLLDAENLRLDINAEKFLAEVSQYPLQVKIAFANWRNHTIGKLDAELYERGYQLIHVPLGQNSADAQMIAMGISISHHYPDAKEVFVCSSDWLLTHLCNGLQRQGMTVYRVRRQDHTLSVENRNTGQNRQYSLKIGTEIPSVEEFVAKIEELIKVEHKSITERIERLSTVTALFQERRILCVNGNSSSSSLVESQNQESIPPLSQPESIPPPPEKEEVILPNSVTPISSPAIRTINSKEEFEQTLVEIIASIQASASLDKVPVTRLSAALPIMCGETANSVVKKLKLGSNFTKYLQSCTTFTVENSGTEAKVTLAKASFPEIKARTDLEQYLLEILKALTAKSPQKSMPLEFLGSEFNKQYGQPISAIIKQLKLDDSFVEFMQASSAFKVEKIGKGYQVAIA
ncbi:MAG: NYN domain-containing protein [Cyanobacteriota bacterium]